MGNSGLSDITPFITSEVVDNSNEFFLSASVLDMRKGKQMKSKCSNCSTPTDPFLTALVNGKLVCINCISIPVECCSHCEKQLGEYALIIGDKKYCSTCEKLYDTCDTCMRHTLCTALRRSVDDGKVCHTCISLGTHHECHVCKKYASTKQLRTLGANLVCSGCHNTHTRCRCCAMVVKREDYLAFTDSCRICAANMVPVKKYSTKATDFCKCWHVNSCGGLSSTDQPLAKLPYYGVELEVEVVGKLDGRGRMIVSDARIEQVARQVLAQLSGFAILKKDSSIKHGFEIVTAPASIKAQKQKWEKFFTWLEQQDEPPIVSFNTDTCGMHVHISRSCLTTMQIGKMMQFMYNPVNAAFITTIAQRNPAKYAEINSMRTIKDCTPLRQEENRQALAWNRQLRHTAFNTIPEKTVELRIFRGNTSRDGFLANLEFCQALMDFCASGVVSIEDATRWENLCEFIHTHHSCYPYLHKFLANKNLVSRVFRERTRRNAKTCA